MKFEVEETFPDKANIIIFALALLRVRRLVKLRRTFEILYIDLVTPSTVT